MKMKDVTIGGRYHAKVSGVVVVVRVLRVREVFSRTRVNGATVWECVNEATGREILVKSAQRFRGEVKKKPAVQTIDPTIAAECKAEATAADRVRLVQLLQANEGRHAALLASPAFAAAVKICDVVTVEKLLREVGQ